MPNRTLPLPVLLSLGNSHSGHKKVEVCGCCFWSKKILVVLLFTPPEGFGTPCAIPWHNFLQESFLHLEQTLKSPSLLEQSCRARAGMRKRKVWEPGTSCEQQLQIPHRSCLQLFASPPARAGWGSARGHQEHFPRDLLLKPLGSRAGR